MFGVGGPQRGVDRDEAACRSTFTPVLSRPGTAEFGRRPIDTSTRSNVCSLSASARPSPSIEDLDAVLGLLHAGDARLQQNLVQRRLEPPREERDEIAIGAGQQAGRHLDDRDLGAERGVDRSEFQADVAAADDEQRLRNLRQIERAGRIHHARRCRSTGPALRRMRAGRDDRVLERRAASAVPPAAGDRSMLSVFASTNDALPWMYVILRMLATAGRAPPVSFSTTLSLNARSLSRSIFGSRVGQAPVRRVLRLARRPWRRAAAPSTGCIRDRGTRRRDSASRSTSVTCMPRSAA